MLPDFRDPVNDLVQVTVVGVLADFHLNELAMQEATKETLDWLHVVGIEYPSGV